MASLEQLQGQREKDEQGYAITVKQPNGQLYLASDDKTPCTFVVYGSESPTYLKRRSEMYREVAKSGEEMDSNTLAVYVSACAVKSWSGWDGAGAPLPCTVENVRALLAFEHLRMQVERAATRGADFFGAGSPA